MEEQSNDTVSELVALEIPKGGLSFEESIALIIFIAIAVFLQYIPGSATVFQNQRNHKKIKKILREKDQNEVKLEMSKYLYLILYMNYN